MARLVAFVVMKFHPRREKLLHQAAKTRRKYITRFA